MAGERGMPIPFKETPGVDTQHCHLHLPGRNTEAWYSLASVAAGNVAFYWRAVSPAKPGLL